MRNALVTLANLAAFAVFAAVVAHWGWRWFGPAPVVVLPGPAPDPAPTFAVSPPFGAAAPVAPQRGSPVAVPADDGRLMGVFAEPGGRGHALFRMPDGSARLVAPGDALNAQTTVVAIGPTGVRVRDGGGERTIALSAATQARGASRTAPAGRAPSPGCAIPASYKGPVVRLNAELVQGLMAQPESLRAIAEARDGGLVVREEAGFAALVGMKKGDRVTQANGIALRAPEDVIVAVLRPLAASQLVRLVGSRGGEPRELYLVNAGACPA